MRERDEKAIELDVILDDIKRYSLSKEGRDRINSSLITTDKLVLNHRYIKIDEIINKLELGNPLAEFPSLSHLFGFVETTQRDINGEDIYLTGEFLHSLSILVDFISKGDEIDPALKEAEEDILSSLDSNGLVREDHKRLLPLIRDREKAKSERYRFSLSFISLNKDIVQNDRAIYRNERVVIPIYTKDKKKGEYYVIGESGSGNTTYVEPFELVDLNNNVVLKEEAIRQEKLKILHSLSEKVRSLIPILKEKTEFVASFNFYYVFALWAKRESCSHIEEGEDISLIDALHPLLGAKAVPITLKINKETKALVLSGANCGGKSVTMKTLALLSALNQISTYIPSSPLSRLPYFDGIYTDIGDGQSIENEESTFSSHMANIAAITSLSSGRSLVILDELGSGTDPEEGEALSLSILKYFSSHSSLTICTSHYSRVKNYAYTEKNMMNASMEFDTKTNKPTYRVLEGIPGDSHALSSAERAHMPSSIIEDAREALGGEKETTAQIITSLLSRSRALERKIQDAERIRKENIEEKKRLEEKEKELNRALLEAEKEGSVELKNYLSQSRKMLENLVRKIKTGELDKEKTLSVKSYIKTLEEKTKNVESDIEKKEEAIEGEAKSFSPGDDVLCGSEKTRGKIIELGEKKSALVLFENGLRMNVKLKDLWAASKTESKMDISNFSSQGSKYKYVLDVRGFTLNETERALDEEIDASLLSGMYTFSVIHGLGDGILQKGVHMYLKKNRYVSDYRFALPEDGGMGKTYVFLKNE